MMCPVFLIVLGVVPMFAAQTPTSSKEVDVCTQMLSTDIQQINVSTSKSYLDNECQLMPLLVHEIDKVWTSDHSY